MGDTFCHWSYTPELVLKDDYDYGKYTRKPFKPTGLWVTSYTDDGWRAWCQGENYGCGDYRFDLRVKTGANLLWLKSQDELDEFTRIFSLDYHGIGRGFFIDWDRLTKLFDGIMVFPCFYRARLEHTWYNTWDCASGCVWKPETALELVDHARLEQEG